jgi:3-oxoacyl-[acyl-carrier-protein] synthase II
MSVAEPIAIVGLGRCFPGGRNAGQLWGPLEGERGTVAADRFDADFFSIDDREAALLDPQHRVLLNTARDAVSDAGFTRESLAGGEVGVFIGQGTGEAGRSTARSMASGWISHAWDLRGPCATVDAACSSGSLAVHLACQSLRAGECGAALAGGVGPVQAPGHSAAGVFVLKRLGQALIDGDTVHAVILGSAQASKGRTAKAVAAPSVEGYRQVIDRACANAGIEPGSLGYVETHAGDLVELQALGEAIGRHRPPGSPCLVGSVKSALGPPEAAGGVAGLIKAALILRHRKMPSALHCEDPAPDVDWPVLGIAPARDAVEWPYPGTAVVGVSTYGLSGTFVHLVLGEHTVA